MKSIPKGMNLIMKTTYTVKKMTLKDSTKKHIETRINKLDKFFDDNATANVMLRLESNRVTAELTIRCGSMVYRAEDTKTDLLEAFDTACDNIVRKIRKQKTKLEKRLRVNAFGGEMPEPTEPEPDEEEYQIIRKKQFSVKPLSVQEAILQMDMVGHEFFMFRNEENGEINVVYRRNDGNFGLIIPE